MRFSIWKLLPFLWMAFVYTGTVLLAGRDPVPLPGPARTVFEARHFVTHVLVFALQVWLFCQAVTLPGSNGITRGVVIAIAVGLVLGVGQETLQAVSRPVFHALDTGWDLLVDVGGSTLGWWLYNRRALRRPLG